jgi:hypothetical protein
MFNARGIMLEQGGVVRELYGDGTHQLSIDAGHIAFRSETPYPFSRTLFSDVSGALQRIIGTGDALDGRVISELTLGPDSLSGSQIVFFAYFTNGDRAVVLATIPEPTTMLWVILGCACFRRPNATQRRKGGRQS